MLAVRTWLTVGWLATATALGIAGGCSGSEKATRDDDDGSGSGQGGGLNLTAGVGGSHAGIATCEDAAEAHSYIGCDFWPTVTANNVWSIFDYAVVVANAGDATVEATVSRGGGVVATASIAPNALSTIYLPWVSELKGPDSDGFGTAVPLSQSVKLLAGA
jgi:hypothetical protein